MLDADIQMLHGAELRRCLIQLDVHGMKKLWQHCNPHLPRQTTIDALCSMHMARVQMRTIPRKLKNYSRDWLRDQNIFLIDGKWSVRDPALKIYSEGVGIASTSSVPGLSKKIVNAMSEALLNGMAKGIMDPPHQKELMLKARAKVRFKGRHI